MRTSSIPRRFPLPGSRDIGVRRAATRDRSRASVRPRAVRASAPASVALALAGLLLGGCEERFDPIAPSDITYSIWGYLDATQDTHWIRVTPVRDVAVTAPGPSDVTVTLERVGSGSVVTLRDSLFSYDRGAGGTLWAYNYWTGEPIEPGAVYRFRAARPGEPTAEADVRIPPWYEPELWVAQVSGTTSYVRLPGIKYVAYAQEGLAVNAGSCVDRTIQTYPILVDSAADGESVMIPLATFHFPETCGAITITGGAQFAASGEAWPSQLEYAPGVLGEADVLGTNITNSVGFLGGLLTRRVPYQACVFVDPRAEGVPAHCKLRFDDGTATALGTVGAPACGVLRIPGALVTLRELEGEPAGARRIRHVRTDLGGEYEVLALRPGVPHELTVNAREAFGVDLFEVYTDTLELTAGEALQHDVGLTPLEDCSGVP
jgi:hypothetical protein